MSASNIERDRIAYEELFRVHFSPLCYFARKYVADIDVSKEIVHKVFVTIWENRDSFDFNKPAKSYLFTSVYNRCVNFIRDQKKFTSTDDADTGLYEQSAPNHDHLEEAELENHIWKVIDSLPEKCREVFILNRFEGKKYTEIAEHLNISVKTVETHISKALSVLREGLKDYIHFLIIFIVKNLW